MFTSCFILSSTIIFIGDPFNILVVTPLFMAVVFIIYEGSFWKRVTLGAMYASTILSFNILRDNYCKPLFAKLEAFLFPEHRILYNEYITEELSLDFIRTVSVFTSLLFTLFLYASTRKSAPDKDYTISDDLWKLLLLLTMAPFGIVLCICILPEADRQIYSAWPHYYITSVTYLLLTLIAIFSFVILLRCIIVLAKQQKLEQQNMLTEINRTYYETMEQQHFEIRRLKHDLANHLQVLSALPEEDRDAYLSDLTENAAITQTISYCTDTTVNAVLTVKKSLMERHDILMKTVIDIPVELPFDKTDLCALYANALDNAIEACLKLPKAERIINLKSKAQKGLFCLEVTNPLPSLAEISPGQIEQKPKENAYMKLKNALQESVIPSTSKSDKHNHGFGLKSINEIVERYHGSLELKAENQAFNLFLYIPL